MAKFTQEIIRENVKSINEFIEGAARKLLARGVPVEKMKVHIRPNGYGMTISVEEKQE